MSDKHTNKLIERKIEETEPNEALDQYLQEKFGAIVICTKGRITSLVAQNPFSYVKCSPSELPCKVGIVWSDRGAIHGKKKHKLIVTTPPQRERKGRKSSGQT